VVCFGVGLQKNANFLHILYDQELIDLSEDLPPTPLNLLKLNLAYQEVIVQEIAKVDNLLKENNYQKVSIRTPVVVARLCLHNLQLTLISYEGGTRNNKS